MASGFVSERDAERIHEILRGPEPGRLTWWQVWVGGEIYAVASCERDAAEGSYGLTLRASVRGMVPEAAVGGDVIYDLVVDGISVRRFTGKLLSAVPSRGRALTEVRAASSGGALPDLQLGSRVSWDQAEPSLAVADALGRAGHEGQVRVESVAAPRFTRKDAEAYSALQSPAEVLEAVSSEIPAFEFWDTAFDGHEAFLRRPLEEAPEPEFAFDARKLENFVAERVEPTASWVVVYRRKEILKAGEDPYEVLARAPVPGSSAPDDAIERIESTDRTASAILNAHQTARDRAAEISERYRMSFTGPLHPLLERGSYVAVFLSGEDAAGRYVKTWSLYLTGITDALPRKRAAYSGEARVSEVAREPVPEPRPLGATGGAVLPAWGIDAAGFGFIEDGRYVLDEDGYLIPLEEVPMVQDAEGFYEYAR